MNFLFHHIATVKQWVEKTNAQRYHRAKAAGPYGGTYARDIAFRVRVGVLKISKAVPAEEVPAVERGGAGPARLECEAGHSDQTTSFTYRAVRQGHDTGGSHAQAGVVYAEEADVTQRGHVQDDREDVA